MDASVLRERISSAFSKGGLSATGVWLLKKALRVEPYLFLEVMPGRRGGPRDPARFAFHCIASPASLHALDARVQEQLNEESGRSVDALVQAGHSVYFLTDGPQVACQLNISPGPFVTIETPRLLQLDIGGGSAFLSFLFTHPRFRRMGAARALVDAVCADLAQKGYRRVLTHVRRTNVASVNTFARMGWRRVATIWATTGPPRRVVLARLRGSNLLVTPIEVPAR
jgi:ribosomal protein S18 acetylase RimI-like enzyme